MITDHKWRPPLKSSTKVRSHPPLAERPCEYAGCDRPRDEHEKSVRTSGGTAVTAVDWSRYRKCPSCGALLGRPCMDLTGTVVSGRVHDFAEVESERPHSRRKLRAGR